MNTDHFPKFFEDAIRESLEKKLQESIDKGHFVRLPKNEIIVRDLVDMRTILETKIKVVLEV